jgi:DNA gyrase subunit A
MTCQAGAMSSRDEELPFAVELQQTEERLHILNGLVRGMQDPRAVLDLVLEAPDPAQARSTLQARLGLDEIQAQAVLDMQVRQATQLNRSKLEEHRQELDEHLQFLRTLDERPPD